MDVLWKYILMYRYCHHVSPSRLFLCTDAPYKYFVTRHYSQLYPLLGLWLLQLSPYNIVMRVLHSDLAPYSLQGLMYYLDINSSSVCSHDIATFKVCQKKVVRRRSATEGDMPPQLDFIVLTDQKSYHRFNPCYEFDLSYGSPRTVSVVCSISEFRYSQVAGKHLFGNERLDRLVGRINNNRPIHVSKLNLDNCHLDSSYILRPGIYKGAFSVGTPQLILLYYQAGWLYCKKLTGDVYIPGGKVIIKVRSVNVNPSSSSVHLDLFGEGTAYTFTSELPHLRFVACYKGEAQFAQRGFLYADTCGGKMYIANEESFVFVTDWLNVSYFTRCNDLSQFL